MQRIVVIATLVILASFFMILSSALAQETDEMQILYYRGIHPDDPQGRDGLRNPERGLRIETLIAEPPGQPAWGPADHLKGKVSTGYSDDWWLLDCARYEAHGLTLAQTYVYLDTFEDSPISEEKLQWLQGAFDNLRSHSLKALLRFAYERDMGGPNGATLERIKEHMAQLKPIIQKNIDVIWVMQAGFVGAWGEWHSSKYHLESDQKTLAQILAGVLDILPPERMTQVRVPKYKRLALEQEIFGGFEEVSAANAFDGSPTSRIGYNNDGFLANDTCGGTWTEGPLFSQPGNPEFDTMTRQSAWVPVDGELFWADQGGKVDGYKAAVRLRLHHYTSLSLAHSYSEREGKPYSIDDWMQTPMNPEQLKADKMPVSDGYFSDANGQPVVRTQFEYIRDHLGYRLELQTGRFPKQMCAGRDYPIWLELINRGFSTLHNPHKVHLVLVSASGNVTDLGDTNANPRNWQPYYPGDAEYKPLTHIITARMKLPEDLPAGIYQLGLWIPDGSDTLQNRAEYAIHLANGDVPWWKDAANKFGINVIGQVTIVK